LCAPPTSLRRKSGLESFSLNLTCSLVTSVERIWDYQKEVGICAPCAGLCFLEVRLGCVSKRVRAEGSADGSWFAEALGKRVSKTPKGYLYQPLPEILRLLINVKFMIISTMWRSEYNAGSPKVCVWLRVCYMGVASPLHVCCMGVACLFVKGEKGKKPAKTRVSEIRVTKERVSNPYGTP